MKYVFPDVFEIFSFFGKRVCFHSVCIPAITTPAGLLRPDEPISERKAEQGHRQTGKRGTNQKSFLCFFLSVPHGKRQDRQTENGNYPATRGTIRSNVSCNCSRQVFRS